MNNRLRRYAVGIAIAGSMLAAAPVFADDALDQAMKNDNNWPTAAPTATPDSAP
jgi:hypothetical protein